MSKIYNTEELPKNKKKKRKKHRTTKGAISVFLSIILVPCITVSSLFVDLGRVRVSKSLTESAGDLALNSLLTHYDFDLQEFYGMAASCQSIYKFYDESEKYFERALKSQGLTDDDTKTLSYGIKNLLSGDKSISDLLQIDLLDDGAEITPVKNANLSNSVMIRDQIVDFMKYRAPIEVLRNSGVLNALNDSAERMEEAKANEELAEEKKEFGDAEHDLIESSYELYKKLKEYQDINKNGIEPNNKDITKIIDSAKGYKDRYKEIHKVFVKNLINTKNLETFNADRSYSNWREKFKLADEEKYNNDRKCSYNNFKVYCNNTAVAVVNFISYYNYVNKIPDWDGSYYPIQYWAQSNYIFDTYNDLFKSGGLAEDLCKEILRLENAEQFLDEDADKKVSDDKHKADISYNNYDGSGNTVLINHYNAALNQAKSLVANRLVSPPAKFKEKMDKLESFSNNQHYKNQIDENTAKLPNGTLVKTEIENIQKELNSNKAAVDEMSKKLGETLKKGWLGFGKDAYDSLADKIVKYKQQLKEWEEKRKETKTSTGKPTEMADEDAAEIEEKKKEFGDLNPNILVMSDAKVKEFTNKLKNRVTKMKEYYDEISAQLENMRYGNKGSGKKIKDLGSISSVRNAINISSIPLKESELDKHQFVFKYKDGNSAYINSTAKSKIDANDPDLDEKPTELWNWLDDKFQGINDEEINENEKKNFKNLEKEAPEDDKNDDNDQKKYNQKNKKDNNSSAEDINGYDDFASGDFPSKFNSSSYSFGKAITGMINIGKEVGGLFGDNPSQALQGGLLTPIYSTEYVTGMFSHFVYENEGKYDLLKEKCKREGWKTSELKSDNYKYVIGSKDEKNTWLSEDYEDFYNKSLTNQMINSQNNHAYGAELEYILYGGKNKDNIASAIASIYLIRFILNTPYGFMMFWGNENDTTSRAVQGIAGLIQEATRGIIPAFITKAVLILILIACESGNDLIMLKEGYPVKFIKWPQGKGTTRTSDPAWACQMSNTNTSKHQSKIDTKEDGKNGPYLRYSGYIYTFLLLGFNSGTQEAMYKRTADVIQANMRKRTETNSYKMSGAITYFDINAKLYVKPLMLNMPININNQQDGKLDEFLDFDGWCTFNYNTSRGYS